MKTLKKKIYLILAIAALLTSSAGGYFYFRDRDVRLIRNLVGELENIAAKRPGKSNALSLLDAATPERVFANQLKVSSDRPQVDRSFTLKEISQYLVAMKKNCSSAALNVEITNIEIKNDQAAVSGSCVFSGSTSGRGSFREVRDVIFYCSKIEKKWKISTIELRSILSK